jgi:hypothetical protein
LINYVIDPSYEIWSFWISMVKIIFMILGFSAFFPTKFVFFQPKGEKMIFFKAKVWMGGGGGVQICQFSFKNRKKKKPYFCLSILLLIFLSLFILQCSIAIKVM